MKHLYALLIKFVVIAVILEIVLGLTTTIRFGNILWMSAIVTILTYLIGDLWVLAVSNNTASTLTNLLISFIILYTCGYWSSFGMVNATLAILSAILLAIFDWFYHKYAVKIVASENREPVVRH